NVGKAIRVQLINILKIVEQFDLSSNIWEINRKDSDKYETIFNEEQTYKLDYFEKVSDLIKCESLFWKAEELEYNNGKILHLIGLAENIVSDSYNLSSFETVLNT